MAKKKEYDVNIRCYFGGSENNYTQHRQTMVLSDIAKWIEAYRFTHPNVKKFNVRVWCDEN